MLHHLTLHNFAITHELELELEQGLSVLTGETGAGKSISLDALNLAMGARADSKVVKAGCERAEIHAIFDISQQSNAQQWLNKQELNNEINECILRRVINKDGRSRAYINGRPSPLSDVQALSQLLVNIHGQHAQQHLLERGQQRELLDRFAKAQDPVKEIKELAANWQKIQKNIQDLQQDESSIASQRELLIYQLQELDALALDADELDALEKEQKRLSQADHLLVDCQRALEICDNDSDEVDLLQMINKASYILQQHPDEQQLSESAQLFSQAQINIEEACRNLRDFSQRFQADPERLNEVQERLDNIYKLARKHRIDAQQLHDYHATLSQQLENIDLRDEQLQQLEKDSKAVLNKYLTIANKLSELRSKAAKQLQSAVTKQLVALHMPNAVFSIDFEQGAQDKPSANGLETALFLISTNPEQAPASLKDIASGGELSRISLAIEVASQASTQVPTLIFDEVDAGIGGATAEVVGKLLRTLGANKQVICVTHQAQLAAQAHHHFNVTKTTTAKKSKNASLQTTTTIQHLNKDQRIDEISRMIGGLSITQTTRDHAEELLRSA